MIRVHSGESVGATEQFNSSDGPSYRTRDLLAVGFENGTIDIYGVDVDNAIACQLIQHIGSE